MNRTLVYHIAQSGESIQEFLRKKGYSRHLLIQLKKISESVLVDGIWQHFHYVLKAGQKLTVNYKETASSEQIPPVKLSLSVVYEDEDVIVINKPADMPVHPSYGNYENTLANALVYYYREKEEEFTFRCVNRLDRDTTGLLVIAKHGISACVLSAQMAKRQIQREYYAIVEGKTPPAGTIQAPIARAADSTIERQVDFRNGEPAVTHFQRIAYRDGYSLLSIRLETGRTHQIRVHMKYMGYPLPGDFLYHPDYSRIQRQALHSAALSFIHPITGYRMQFRVGLPEDFVSFFPFHKG